MKLKEIIQVIIVLTFIFSVGSILEPAEAQSQQVCCAETISGDHCQYTDQNNCKPGVLQAATSCEQTSFCKLGCGFDSGTGRCFENTPKETCQSRGDCTWTESPSCDIPQCQRGCCVLSNQCSFVTQLQCKKITSQFEDINMTFDEGITDEFTCINECRSFERGACVQGDGSCTFTTRESCVTGVQQQTNLNITGGAKEGFYPNRLCSHPQLGTECAPQQYTGCLPDRDEVYWFDSCGNPENIYEADKQTSYNGGLVRSKEESCNPNSNNLESTSCGNCDFVGGTLCGVAPRSINPVHGEYTCLDLSCKDITVSPTSPSSRTGEKKLGESWCAYDGTPGFGRDLVGSRHYRRLCINGQELTEPCKDYREEICVQGVQGQPPLPTQAAFTLSQGDYIESICRPNRHLTCSDTENQYDCQNLQARDCYWIGNVVLGVTNGQANIGSPTELSGALEQTPEVERAQRRNEEGQCVPIVSPGLTFWPGETETETSELDPKSTCEVANSECTVTYQRAGLLGGVFSGDFGDTGWNCVGNCACLETEYLQARNNICKSLGDCGAWFNIKGEFTNGGFIEDSGKDLTEADVESYDSLISPVDGQSEYDDKFNAFFNQAAPGLTIIGLTGIGTVIAYSSLGYGTLELGAAFTRGALSGFNGFFGLEAFGEATYAEIAGQSFASAVPVGKPLAAGSTFTAGGVPGKAVVLKGLSPATNAAFTTQGGISGNAIPLGSYTTANTPTGVLIQHTGDGLLDVTIAQAQTAGKAPIMSATVPPAHNTVGAGGKVIAGPKTFNQVGMDIPPQSGAWGQTLQFINTLAWIYTIYSLLDVILSDTKTEVITTTCEPWTAPTGGSDCNKCDEEGKECSEYRCRSLGQLCKLLNAGTEEEACINSNPNDATSPIIKADVEALERGYTLTEVAGQGYRLNEEIEPFTAVSLGIETNEYAQCKFSTEHSTTYDEMTNNFGEGNYVLNHSMTFGLSSILAQQQALQLTNGGQYTLYIRCQDGNGNQNNKPYYIKFAIKKGPDFTAPIIESTSIPNGAYLPAGINVTSLTVYTNEPSECAWSDIDEEYKDMPNIFSCSQSQLPTTSIYYGLYDCNTILTNLRDNFLNTRYIKCADKATPTANVNSQSYVYTLQGTQQLELVSVTPQSGTIFYMPDPTIKVITSKGAQGGVAVCGYSFIDNNPVNAITFLNTNSSVHEQQFQALLPGTYQTFITCMDIAGNTIQTETTFDVQIDLGGPVITNLYTQGTILHLSTNEPSSCEFSTTSSFSFGQGTPMTGDDTTEHETTVDGNIYYIVCQDSFENEASYKVFI